MLATAIKIDTLVSTIINQWDAITAQGNAIITNNGMRLTVGAGATMPAYAHSTIFAINNSGSHNISYVEFYYGNGKDVTSAIDVLRMGITLVPDGARDPAQQLGYRSNEYGILTNGDSGANPPIVMHNNADAGFTYTPGEIGPSVGGYNKLGMQYNKSTGELRFIKANGHTLCYKNIGANLQFYIAASVSGGETNLLVKPSDWTIPVGSSGDGRDPNADPMTIQIGTPGPFYVADMPYMSAPGDTPANQQFEDRLIVDSSLVRRRSLNFWPWGANPTVQSSSGVMNVDNADITFDQMLTAGCRDVPITIYCGVGEGYPLSSPAYGKVMMQVNSLANKSDSVMTFNCVGADATFANQFETSNVTTTWNGQSVLVKYPLSFGYVRSIPLTAINPSNIQFTVADDPRFIPTTIYDKGYPLSQTKLATPDWTFSNGVETLATNFVGVGTADLAETNIALLANEALPPAVTSVAGTNYAASYAFNGDRTGKNWGTSTYPQGGWSSTVSGPTLPQSITRYFSKPMPLKGCNLYFLRDVYSGVTTEPDETTTFTLYSPTAFKVQYLDADGVTWHDVSVVTGNNKVLRKFDYTGMGIVTTGVRVVVTASPDNVARVVSFEVMFQPQGSTFDEAIAYLTSYYADSLPAYMNNWNVGQYSRVAPVIGYYSSSRPKQMDVLTSLARAYNASFYFDRNNNFTAIQMVDPGTLAADWDIVYTISANDMKDDILVTMDNAINLTNRMQGRPNYQTLSEFSTDASITANVKAALSGNYQVEKTSRIRLAPYYKFAESAPAQGVIIDNEDGIQGAIDDVCSLYAQQRFFAKFTVKRSDFINLDLGLVIVLNYSDANDMIRYNLDGMYALIVGMEEDLLKDETLVTVWF